MKTMYEEIAKLNPSWLTEFTDKITKLISTAKEELKREAEYCGESKFADENYLYERFKDNVENGMYFGNWEVLKYFSRILKIKVMEEMLGKWTFTKQDKEMYDYFNNVKVDGKIKCKPAILKYNAGSESTVYFPNFENNKYSINYEFEDLDETSYYKNYIVPVPYDSFFRNHFVAIDNIIRNVKMLTKCWIDGEYDLFETKDRYSSYYITEENTKDKKLVNKSAETIKQVKREAKSNLEKLHSIFLDVCYKSKEYQDLLNQMVEFHKKIMPKFISDNKKLYDSLTKSEQDIFKFTYQKG